MSKHDKSLLHQKIDRKWVREYNRTFCEYPGVPRSGLLGEEETWLELAQFYRDDLKWLLSLDHHKFWSHMMYSRAANALLVSFLKGSPPNCLRRSFLAREDMLNIFKEIERLVFFAFFRLSLEKESSSCFIRNFREVIYDNYLFTVPIILDICLIYGTSNRELVKKMISNVVIAAPDFLDDFQEIIPHFLHVLKTVEHKFSDIQSKSTLEENLDFKVDEVEDVMLYLSDAVSTVQVFIEVYPNICQLFSKVDCIIKIGYFYSKILPVISNYCSEKNHLKKKESKENPFSWDLVENIRIDLLKIVKSVLDFVLNESKEIPGKKESAVNEYLTLITKLSTEPYFFSDYNLMYPIKNEVGCAIKNSQNMDLPQMNQILEEVLLVVSDNQGESTRNLTFEELELQNESGVTFNSLVTEVKDILPHLDENFIKKCLNYYNNSTEKVIAAVLENLIPPDLNETQKEVCQSEGIQEFKGKHKNKHRNLNEMLNDRKEINKMKEKYAELSFVTDETYDDEYDDTYDENVDIPMRDGEESVQRPFVVPRVLRTGHEIDEEVAEEEEEESEAENGTEKDHFVENPAVVRERMRQTRLAQRRRDVTGTGKSQGQSKEVLKNREFKESHKAHYANHNRKKQAGRKMARGLIPP